MRSIGYIVFGELHPYQLCNPVACLLGPDPHCTHCGFDEKHHWSVWRSLAERLRKHPLVCQLLHWKEHEVSTDDLEVVCQRCGNIF